MNLRNLHFLIDAALRTLLLCGTLYAAEEDRWLIRDEETPSVKGFQRGIRSGASAPDSLKPPVTPQRQSERRRPPAPDNLLGKVIWGKEATFTSSSGRTLPVADWNLVPVDAAQFVEKAGALGARFGWGNVNLNQFSYDPLKTPCLLFSGVRTLRLNDTQLRDLQQYVMRGGMIVCDSVYGSPYFSNSVRELFEQAFPSRRFRVIPLDHPLYHIYHKIDFAHRPEHPAEKDPFLEGIYVGSRIGVLLARDGLGTGWQGNQDIMRELKARGLQPRYYDVASARRIGLNLAAYIVGYTAAGLAEAVPELIGQPDGKTVIDQLVFAQLRHEGAWDVHPGAARALQEVVSKETRVHMDAERVSVDPGRDRLAPYPFLFLSGLDDFVFSPAEIEALRRFFEGGGRLLVNNGLGLATFDRAVRRELLRIVPQGRFTPLPPDHPIFTYPNAVIPAAYTPALLRIRPDLGVTPRLEGLDIGGELAVIYSPFDIEAGWVNAFYPLLKGYESRTAYDLGVNILTYILMH